MPDNSAWRNYWLLDCAILLPGNTTRVADNCRVMLSDGFRNIQGAARHPVEIRGSLCDSIIDGFMNCNTETQPVTYTSGMEIVRNVTVTNAYTAEG